MRIVQMAFPRADNELLGLRIAEVIALPDLEHDDLAHVDRFLENSSAAEHPERTLGRRLIVDNEYRRRRVYVHGSGMILMDAELEKLTANRNDRLVKE